MLNHLESKIHHGLIDKAIRAFQPTMHLHGHMHRYIRWQNRVGANYVDSICLDMDGSPHSVGTYELVTGWFELVN